MAKLFSVASWNVEHFKGDGADSPRVQRVVDFLAEQKPDIFALFEVEGKTVFDTLVEKMPGYFFQITEGVQTQEILVGVKRTITPLITQRTEYRSGTTHMRPGQLVSFKIGDEKYAILFLHLASGVDPRGMGLRDDMVMRAIDFKKTLDKAAAEGKRANYIFLGDLNSMGLEYPNHNIPSTSELAKWDKEAKKKKYAMRRLAKTHHNSWSNGSQSSIPDSALDHAYAADHLTFKSFAIDGGGSADVVVRGWVDKSSAQDKDQWIKDFSDHSLIYFEVHSAP
jgi:endonuclease/exonuclease/phosphatase family metal-dependent hydrolase